MNENEIIEETFVYIVKENNSLITVFATLDSAKNYILRKIGEIKDNFITTSWHLNVVSDDYTYKIKCYTWYFGLFYYERILSSFEIDQQVIRM